MVAQLIPKLGTGIYSIKEAAFYARIPTQTMARWLIGNKSGDPVLTKEYQSEDKTVSFLDFIQTLAVRAIRIEKKIPLPRIRQAVQLAEKDYGVRFPLAQRHCIYLVGSEIIIKLKEDEYVVASGRHAKNRCITKVVETYMVDIAFGDDGFAKRFMAFKWDDVPVNMDPRIRFGEPLVGQSGYTAAALWQAAKVEGGIENAAQAYGVRYQEVDVACRFMDHLSSIAA